MPLETVQGASQSTQTWLPDSARIIPEDPNQRVSDGVVGLPPLSSVGGPIDTCEEFAYQATYSLTHWVERLVKQQTSSIEGWERAKQDFLQPGAQTISITDINGVPLPRPGPSDWGHWFDFTSIIFAWDRANSQVNYGFGSGRSVIVRDMGWHLFAEQELGGLGFSLQQLEDIRDKTKEFESLLGELGYTHRHMYEAVQKAVGLDDGVPPDEVLNRLLNDLGRSDLGVFLVMAEGLAAEFHPSGRLSAQSGRWRLSRSHLLGDVAAPEGFAYADDHSLFEYFAYPTRNLSPLLKLQGEFAASMQGDPPFESIFADPGLSAFTQAVAPRVDDRMVAALAGTLRASTVAHEVFTGLEARRQEVINRLDALYDELQPVCNHAQPACVWAPSHFIEAVQRFQSLVYQTELLNCRRHTGGPVQLDPGEMFQVTFTIPEIPDTYRPRGPLPPGVSHPDPGRTTWEDPNDPNQPWNDHFDFDYTADLASMRRFFGMKRFYEALRAQMLRAQDSAKRAALLTRERMNIDPATGLATFAHADSDSKHEGNRTVSVRFSRDRFHDERLPRASGTIVANAADACTPICSARLEGAENTSLRASLGTDISILSTRTDRATGLSSSAGVALPQFTAEVKAFGNVVQLSGGESVELYENGTMVANRRISAAVAIPAIPGLQVRADGGESVLYDAQGDPWLVRRNVGLGIGFRATYGAESQFMIAIVPVVVSFGISGFAELSANFRSESGVGCVCDPEVASSVFAMDMGFRLQSNVYGSIGIGVSWASAGVKGELGLVTFSLDAEQQKIKGTGSPCHEAALAESLCDVRSCSGGACTPGVCQASPAPPPPGCNGLVCARDGGTVGYTCGDVFRDPGGNAVTCDRCFDGQDTPTLGEADVWSVGMFGTVLGGRISLYAKVLFASWEKDIARFAPILFGEHSFTPHPTNRSRMLATELARGSQWATLSEEYWCDDLLLGHVLDFCGGAE